MPGFLVGRHPAAEAEEGDRASKPVRLMPRYMLDADTVSYAIRGEGQVAARLLEH